MPPRQAFTALVLLLATSSAAAAQGKLMVYYPATGASAPVLVKQVQPEYTPEARAAHIQGTALLSTVVRDDGVVSDVRVVQPLDPMLGLDRQAIKAVEQWQFEPAMENGKPVAMRVLIEVPFLLKSTK